MTTPDPDPGDGNGNGKPARQQSGNTIGRGPTPYVGLRPYRRNEKDWFYGREDEARIITDKTLAARLTLLYAPSGCGKSSVLNAGVLPALEAEDCAVLYFDAWAGPDPLSAVKERLGAMGAAMGVAHPLAGAPTLAELARLLSAGGKTLVVILDQFEEFLLIHADALDPLRKEVAELVRTASIDARVLLCLREEFLAALEPFRQSILTLFQSTYRLEPLSLKDVRKAIVEPARRFGGDIEDGLVDVLIADLSTGEGHAAAALEKLPHRGTVWLTRHWRRWFGKSDARTAPIGDATAPRRAIPSAATAIDLPMLQLACEQIWMAAPLQGGRKALTRTLYQTTLGGKDRIIKNHMRACMPSRWRDRLLTAQLMLYLAPSSGRKSPYSAADLSRFCGSDRRRIAAELLRLSEAGARILRGREFHGEVLYELQHDALVQHIEPWRDAVLERATLVRRLAGAVAVAAVLLGFFGYSAVMDRLDTTNKLASLGRMPAGPEREAEAPGRFEFVTDHLLNRDHGSARLDFLKHLLQEYAPLLPANYALGASDNSAALPGLSGGGSYPFVLRYSQDRPFNSGAFASAWAEVAEALTRRWAIPVPQRIATVVDPNLPADEIVLESSGKPVIKLLLRPIDESSAILQAGSMAGPALEFHRRFAADWSKPDDASTTGWWVVPHWSLPVWKFARLPVRAAGAYPAYALEAALDSQPWQLATPEATRFLVQHVAYRYPCTAAEAWARRGNALVDDLKLVLRDSEGAAKARALGPHLLLDLLAGVTDDKGALAPLRHSGGYADALAATPRGAWPIASASTDGNCVLPVLFTRRVEMTSFGAAAEWLPPLRSKVRIALGADLVREWSNALGPAQPGTIKTEVANTKSAGYVPAAAPASGARTTVADSKSAGYAPAAAAPAPAAITTVADSKAARASNQTMSMETLPAPSAAYERQRRRMYERTGLWLPDAQFSDAGSEATGGRARHFRIALLDAAFGGETIDAGSTDSAGLDRLMDHLDRAVEPQAAALVDADYVGALLRDDHVLRSLAATWTMPSLTDLSVLLREVLGAQPLGPDAVAAGRTLRDPAWLLSSLVFWRTYYENGDSKNPPADLLSDLGGHLRDLQVRRAAAPQAATAAPAAAAIERGIDALLAGNFKQAEAQFERAIKTGPYGQVPGLFAERYAARWGDSVRMRAQSACQTAEARGGVNLKPGTPFEPSTGLRDRTMLQQDLQTWLQSPRGSTPASRDLATCMLASLRPGPVDERNALLMASARRYGDPGDWPAEQAWWLALELLRQYDPLQPVPGMLEQGSRFMESAVRRFGLDRAGGAHASLLDICDLPGPKNWCLEQLVRYAESTDSPWPALDLAVRHSARAADGRIALEGLKRAAALAARHPIPNTDRQRFDFYLLKGRLDALDNLGEALTRSDIERLVQLGTAAAADDDMRRTADIFVVSQALLAEQPRGESLLQAAHKLLADWPEDPEALSAAASVGLRLGNGELVAKAVDQATVQAKSATGATQRTLLFVAAYAGLVTGHKDAIAAASRFIPADHEYAPIIALLLHTHADARSRMLAQRRLNQLWRDVKPQSWQARLDGGDHRAWYEMLLGYFKGEVKPEVLFGPLRDDAAFEVSGLKLLGITRRNALTEANFYDALKRQAQGDAAGSRASLQRVIESGTRNYLEYSMAMQLLRNGPDAASNGASAPRR